MTSKRVLLDDLNTAISTLVMMFDDGKYDDVLASMGRGQTPEDMRKMLMRWAEDTRTKSVRLRVSALAKGGGTSLDGAADQTFRREVDKLIYELRGIYSRFQVYVPAESPFLKSPAWQAFDAICTELLEDLKDVEIIDRLLNFGLDL